MSALRMGEHNRVLTLHVDVGRVAMAGRYAEIGKTVMLRTSILCEPTRISDLTPRPHFKRFIILLSLEENMDATRKAVVAVALAEDQAIQYK